VKCVNRIIKKISRCKRRLGEESSNPDENDSQVENWTLLYLVGVDWEETTGMLACKRQDSGQLNDAESVIRCCRGNRKPNTDQCSDAVLAAETEIQLTKGEGGRTVLYIAKLNEDLRRILQQVK